MEIRKIRARVVDITGLTYGYWTVLNYDTEKSGNRKTYWLCKCKCGVIKSVRSDQLKRWDKKKGSYSCGCHKKELLKERCTIHGLYKHPLYIKWVSMKQRCNNPNNTRHKDYGGRGITVCVEWEEFSRFYTWAIESGYKEGLTIDRKDNNGNYAPENCRFLSNKVQQLNRSNNRLVEIGNIIKTVKEWCTEYGINRNTFVWRLNNGWVGKDLIEGRKDVR